MRETTDPTTSSSSTRATHLVDLPAAYAGVQPAPDVATAMCPHCGCVKLFPGLTTVLAYVCHECGRSVTPDLEPRE
jgi:uncharacterized protein (DUF983 family)